MAAFFLIEQGLLQHAIEDDSSRSVQGQVVKGEYALFTYMTPEQLYGDEMSGGFQRMPRINREVLEAGVCREPVARENRSSSDDDEMGRLSPIAETVARGTATFRPVPTPMAARAPTTPPPAPRRLPGSMERGAVTRRHRVRRQSRDRESPQRFRRERSRPPSRTTRSRSRAVDERVRDTLPAWTNVVEQRPAFLFPRSMAERVVRHVVTMRPGAWKTCLWSTADDSDRSITVGIPPDVLRIEAVRYGRTILVREAPSVVGTTAATSRTLVRGHKNANRDDMAQALARSAIYRLTQNMFSSRDTRNLALAVYEGFFVSPYVDVAPESFDAAYEHLEGMLTRHTLELFVHHYEAMPEFLERCAVGLFRKIVRLRANLEITTRSRYVIDDERKLEAEVADYERRCRVTVAVYIASREDGTKDDVVKHTQRVEALKGAGWHALAALLAPHLEKAQPLVKTAKTTTQRSVARMVARAMSSDRRVNRFIEGVLENTGARAIKQRGRRSRWGVQAERPGARRP